MFHEKEVLWTTLEKESYRLVQLLGREFDSVLAYLETAEGVTFLKTKAKVLVFFVLITLFFSYSGRIFVAEQEEVNKICEDYQKIQDKYGLFERMFIQLFLVSYIFIFSHFLLHLCCFFFYLSSSQCPNFSYSGRRSRTFRPFRPRQSERG